jgi:hypothetical protein
MTKAIKDRVVGVWELAEAKIETPDGKVIELFGPSPLGLGIITENGYVSAQIMRAGRTKFTRDMPTQEEKQQAYDDYLAYYGRFSIDEEKGIMTTLVEGATNANWLGDEQVRYYEFKGDNYVILRTPPFNRAGLELVGTLAWKRRKWEYRCRSLPLVRAILALFLYLELYVADTFVSIEICFNLVSMVAKRLWAISQIGHNNRINSGWQFRYALLPVGYAER